MSPQLGSLFLNVAGISAVAALMCVLRSREASIDVRIWLALAVVAASLYAATFGSA